MVMTQSALLFLGSFATGLAYLGLFKNFSGEDRWTRVLLLFSSAMVWGVFGLSSYDVIIATTETAPLTTRSEPILPMVYLGFGLAFIVTLFGVYELFQAIARDASDATDGMLS